MADAQWDLEALRAVIRRFANSWSVVYDIAGSHWVKLGRDEMMTSAEAAAYDAVCREDGVTWP